MADSNITLSNLLATGGIGQVSLQWDTPNDPNSPDGLPYLKLSAVEVWASSSNDRSLATMVGEQPASNGFLHTGLSRGATFYYWIKARNVAGLYGEWHPVSSTGGVQGDESNSDVSLTTPGWFQNKNGPLDQWGTVTASGGLGLASATWPRPFTSQLFEFHGIAEPYSGPTGALPIVPVTIALVSFDLDGFVIRCQALNPNGGPSGTTLVIIDAANAVIHWDARGI